MPTITLSDLAYNELKAALTGSSMGESPRPTPTLTAPPAQPPTPAPPDVTARVIADMRKRIADTERSIAQMRAAPSTNVWTEKIIADMQAMIDKTKRSIAELEQ